MLKRWTTWAGLAAAILLAGCATPTRMAFHDDAQRIEAGSKPVMLMKATIRNQYRPSFQPRLLVLHVERPDAKEAKDRINFTMDDKAKLGAGSPEEGNTYLLRMELEPGQYEIRGLTSMAGGFPIIGSFFAPMHMPLEVREGGVYYLGHVRATVRERQGNEFRAGPPIPLIDQAVVGASGGTFDVEMLDGQAEDEALFRTRFPALRADIPIHKAMLPAFDRAKAQEWWEKH